MIKFFGAFFLVLIFFVAGFYRSFSFKNDFNRDPAAIRKDSFDFSFLQGDQLVDAAKRRVLAGLELHKNPIGKEIGMGISLGHFVFADENGQKQLACDSYKKVTFAFEAEGVSVAGEKPVMELEGRCEFSPDMTKINPLYLPIAKILGERPGDGEFEFNDGPKVLVRFTNLPEDWPKTWMLKSIRLTNENNTSALEIESSDVAKFLGRQVILKF